MTSLERHATALVKSTRRLYEYYARHLGLDLINLSPAEVSYFHEPIKQTIACWDESPRDYTWEPELSSLLRAYVTHRDALRAAVDGPLSTDLMNDALRAKPSGSRKKADAAPVTTEDFAMLE